MKDLKALENQLIQHPIYLSLNSLKNIQTFMEGHVFAVWDFMSLLKSIQRHVTCVEVPWKPSNYPTEVVRFINEIVVAEESDLDAAGIAKSHFEIYLQAMEEVGADTSVIKNYLKTLNDQLLPIEVKEFVTFNLNLAKTGSVQAIASAFFYGREKLIPEIFTPMIKVLEENSIQAPSLLYYLKRHVQIDGDEHGPMGKRCLEILCDNNEEKIKEVFNVAKQSLLLRQRLWDNLYLKMAKSF